MFDSHVFYFRTPAVRIAPDEAKGLIDFLVSEPLDLLRRIADELERCEGYLSRAGRKEILTRILDNSGKVTQYESALNLTEKFLLDHSGIEDLLSAGQDGQNRGEVGQRNVFSPEELTDLKRRLEIIARPYPSRQRQVKAERLSTATGLRVESIDLICDLRPVFDEGRTGIEGLLPFTTLRVVASGVDRFPICFEAVLSVKDVESLLNSAKAAVAKLTALGDFAAAAHVIIPRVELTETGQ